MKTVSHVKIAPPQSYVYCIICQPAETTRNASMWLQLPMAPVSVVICAEKIHATLGFQSGLHASWGICSENDLEW